MKFRLLLPLLILPWLVPIDLAAREGSLFGTTLIADIAEAAAGGVAAIDTITYESTPGCPALPPEFHQNVIPRKGQGSGVLIDEEGHIVTNKHVVERADEIIVSFKNGKVFKGKLVGEDEGSDLAILKIEKSDIKPLPMGDSDTLRPGEWVVVLGNPLGLGITVTAGVISAVDRQLVFGDNRVFKKLIQTDAAINPGNSGGPLVNTRGEIVAIATAVVQHYQGLNYQNISFAIPINTVKRIVSDLIAYGVVKKSFIGVGIADFPNSQGGEGHGVFVEKVYDNTPARVAGLQPEDLITHINETKIPDSRKFGEVMKNFRVGEKIRLTVVRNRQVSTREVHLTEAPAAEEIPIPVLGIRVTGARQKGGAASPLTFPHGGVLIAGVEKDSLALTNGLQVGDVIGKINDYPVSSPEEFHFAMSQIGRGENILLLTLRGGTRRYLVVKIR